MRIVELSSDLSICLGIEDHVQHSVSLDSASYHVCQECTPTAEPQCHLHSDPFIFSLERGLPDSQEFSMCNACLIESWEKEPSPVI